ncbi:hypothetical protein ABZ714_11600 [Streptomyces sp. NPDC006798]|uniref:hypothetical protein n=1 Tax=Streptomyces sp. NPDC006798 TaxID=3155462 RepID=UPI0033C6225C
MVPCGLDQSAPESDGPADLGRPEYGRSEHGRPEYGRPGRGAGQLPERRRSDARRIDYRTPPPDLCGPAGTKPGAGGGTGHRTRAAQGGASPGEPGEDTLFLFLKSLHQFLTAPQDVATARSAPPVRSEPSPATDATAVAEDGGGHRPAPDGPTGPDTPG